MDATALHPVTRCTPQLPNEAERLALLHSLELLDTPSEAAFDGLARLAAQITGRPVGLIGLVDAERTWFKAKVGLDAVQTPREFAFCAHTIAGTGVFEVCDAHVDPRFADTPLVVDAPSVRYYAGVPIVVNELPVGSLCVVDRVPHRLDDAQRDGLVELGRLANTLIERRLVGQTRRRFIASMSQEVRAPMNAMLGFAQLLGYEPGLSPLARSKVDRIVEAGGHLRSLIDEALDFMRIDAGAAPLDIGETDVDTVIESVHELLEPLAHERGIRLQSAVPSAVCVHADSRRLRQVLFNLAGNAIKYAGGGASVAIGARNDDGWACIDVADDGPGLTHEQLDRLFEPFERLGHAAGSAHGTGLGLSLSRRLVESMRGRIEVKSEPGHGTTFTVKLPSGETVAAH
jgi:signal transduction histidine kinase